MSNLISKDNLMLFLKYTAIGCAFILGIYLSIYLIGMMFNLGVYFGSFLRHLFSYVC